LVDCAGEGEVCLDLSQEPLALLRGDEGGARPECHDLPGERAASDDERELRRPLRLRRENCSAHRVVVGVLSQRASQSGRRATIDAMLSDDEQ
jgi:hypothetical protein